MDWICRSPYLLSDYPLFCTMLRVEVVAVCHEWGLSPSRIILCVKGDFISLKQLSFHSSVIVVKSDLSVSPDMHICKKPSETALSFLNCLVNFGGSKSGNLYTCARTGKTCAPAAASHFQTSN